MALRLTETSKGKPAILFENFLYRLKKETAKTKIWQCVKKDCTGKLTTNLETDEILHGSTDHNHDADIEKTQVQLLRQACKRKAEDDLTERPRKILITEAGKTETDYVSQQSINKVRKAMWRQRRKTHPALPKTRQEALAALSGIQPKRSTTVIDTDEEHELAWMYSSTSVEYIKDVQFLFGDGTFKSSPKQFYQIYTIFGYKDKHYIPIVFFLLPGKSKAVYQKMWSTFKSLYEQVNGATLDNKTIYLDFEKQAHDAAREVLRDVTLRGCLFHLKQSWWRKIQQLGLATEFKDQESEIGSFLRLTFGLPFLDYMDIF